MAQSGTTKRRREQPRAHYWRGVIAQWKDSGLTQTEFCRQKRLSLPALRWWKWKLAQQERQEWQPAFLPIRVVEPVVLDGCSSKSKPVDETSDNLFEIISQRGYRIRIPEGFDSEALVRLLRALEAASC
jgi:hypothetical protein